MKRRTYLKGLFAFGAASVTSFSLFKWFDVNSAIQPARLREKHVIISELSEMIIPRTNTPGAKDAGVGTYVINVLLNSYAVREQHKFLSGLNDLEQYSIEQYDNEFMKCSAAERLKILEHSAKNDQYSYAILNKINNKFFGRSFFTMLRNLTVEGYCLSKVGATQGLAYDYIPGKYEACIPLQPNQKSWATK